ncbi:MAG: 3D domain-containing protein, partial [Thermoleophilia bacterium]|nr:3D domain-containing protein [Thermoleophilia bacterium]
QAARERLRALRRALANEGERLAEAERTAGAHARALARLRAEKAASLERLLADRRRARASQRAMARPAGAHPSPPAPAVAPPPPATPSARTLRVVASGYALTGPTASGVQAGWGVVAVDPAVIPLGTRLTVPGYGEAVAADVGSAVRGAEIDLWFPSQREALAWGRRTVTITLHRSAWE